MAAIEEMPLMENNESSCPEGEPAARRPMSKFRIAGTTACVLGLVGLVCFAASQAGSTNLADETDVAKTVGLATLPDADYYLIKDMDSGKCFEAADCASLSDNKYDKIVLATCSTSEQCQKWTVTGNAADPDTGGDDTGCAIGIMGTEIRMASCKGCSHLLGDIVPGVVAHKTVDANGDGIRRRRDTAQVSGDPFADKIKIDPGERRRSARRRNHVKLVSNDGSDFFTTSSYWDAITSGSGSADNFQFLAEGGDAVDQYTWGCYNNDQDGYDR